MARRVTCTRVQHTTCLLFSYEARFSIFVFQFSLEVKEKEKRRLDRVLREEETKLQRAETELRLAQQAFDQFLQQNDSEAIRAQKR